MNVVFDGALSAKEAMQRDHDLLQHASTPLLRFYLWESPSITYGVLDSFVAVGESVPKTAALQIAQRPTGGARLLHQHDLAFSLFIPLLHGGRLPLSLGYEKIHQALLDGICAVVGIEKERSALVPNGGRSSRGGYCMATASYHDPLIDGKKIAGGAQRRTTKAFLHQGSIFLSPPQWEQFKGIVSDEELLQMQQTTTSIQELVPNKAISVDSVIELVASSLVACSSPWVSELA